MKAKLIFDFDNPDDKMDFKRCVKSTDMAIVLFEIHYNLRRQIEAYFDGDSITESETDFTVRLIKEIFEEHNINIDELIN